MFFQSRWWMLGGLLLLACPGPTVPPPDAGDTEGGVIDGGAVDGGRNQLSGPLAFEVRRADLLAPGQWDGAADWGNLSVMLNDDPTVSACGTTTSALPAPITRTQLLFGVTAGHPTALTPQTFDGSDGGPTFAFVQWLTTSDGGSVFSPATITVSAVAGSLVTGTFAMHARSDGGPSPLGGTFEAVPCSVQVDTELNLSPPFEATLALARNSRQSDGGANPSVLDVGFYDVPPAQSQCGGIGPGPGRTVWIRLTEFDGGQVGPGGYAVNGPDRKALVWLDVVSDGGFTSRLASSGSVELSVVDGNGVIGTFSAVLNAPDGGLESVSGKFLAQQFTCP